MFATIPVLNATNHSEERIINLDNIEEVKPHANVNVAPENVSTACSEIRFYSGTAVVVLLDMTTMKSNLKALLGTVDEYGTLS